MASGADLSENDIKRLQGLRTCDVSNAIERFDVRLRNEGFVNGSVRCQFPDLPPMLGYAVTGRARSSFPPISGRYYHTSVDWWYYLDSIPAPRVMVIQDVDEFPGSGALIGNLGGAIGMALNCVGAVTNGAVRDLPQLSAMGFAVFAGSVVVSHSYSHIVDFGEPVEIGGLKISPGDLIHGDLHGVHTIPLSVAPDLPDAVEEVRFKEREFVEFCRSPQFSLQKLMAKLDEVYKDGYYSERQREREQGS